MLRIHISRINSDKMGNRMQSDEFSGRTQIHSNSRTYQRKKKINPKTFRTSGYRRPTLLLRNLSKASRKIRKKLCTKCKETKWLSEFYISHKPGRGPSYKSECKRCGNSRARESILRHRKKKNEGGDPVYQAYQRAYYQKNIERFREYRRQFLFKNPDYFKCKSKERYQRIKQESTEAKCALHDKDCA